MHLSERARRILGYAMVLTLAFALVFATVAFGAVMIDMKALVYGVAIILALMWAIKLLLARSVSWKYSPMHWPVLAFALYACIRYLTAQFEYDARMELFQVILCVFFYFAAAFNFYHHRDRSILLNVLVVFGMLEAALALWQFYSHAEYIFHIPRPEGYLHRGSGTLICPNHLAGFLGMILGLALAYLAIDRGRSLSVQKATLFKVYLVYATVVIIAGILVTLSRAGLAATAIGALAVLLWGDWRKRYMWPRLAVAATTLIVLVVISVKVQMVRDYITYTFTVNKNQDDKTFRDPTLGGRVLMWQSTLSIIREHPLVGTGPGSWQYYHLQHRMPRMQMRPQYAHNDILNLASDYGLIGFAIGLAAMVCFYRHASLLASVKAHSPQRALAVGVMVAATVILIHSWFDFGLHILSNALLLSTLMGLTVAMDDPENRYRRLELPPRMRRVLAAALVLFSGWSVWQVAPSAIAYRQMMAGDSARFNQTLDPEQRMEEALRFYGEAVQVDPKFPDPFFKAGSLLLSRAFWRVGPERAEKRAAFSEEAISALRQAVELRPLDSRILLRLAQAYDLHGDTEQALATFLRAVAVDPNSAEVNLQLGLHYRRHGEDEKAKVAFEKSKKLSMIYNPVAEKYLK